MKREPTNHKDKNAMVTYEEDSIAGHVYTIHLTSLDFWQEMSTRPAFAEVTEENVNRGAGYGLEIPCVYRVYVIKLKNS